MAMTISYISVTGGRVCVETEGNGPLIVCSPAMGDTRDAFAPFSSLLAEAGFRVARADLRGHGDSSTDFAAYGDEATAKDLLAVIEKFGGGPAILAGASMSAAAAVIAAGMEPAKVSGLVLLGPFLRGTSTPLQRLGFRLALARPWGPALWRLYSAKLWPGLGDHASQRASHLSSTLKRKGHWAAFSKTTRTDHSVVSPWFDHVKAPALIVMGDKDPDWKDPLAEATWAASRFTQSEVLAIKGSGHAPMLEFPDAVAQSVISFANRIGFVSAHA